jgi:calreticulin
VVENLGKMASTIALLLAVVGIAHCTIHFKETFDDADAFGDKWIYSTSKGSDAGKMEITAGKFFGDKQINQGMKTSQDAKFYQISTGMEKFSNEGKQLVLQFSVKHEQNIDCGGGYIKLFPSSLDSKTMNGDSPYHIMFGPDICGPGTKRVHVIFTYKEKNHLIKKDIRCKDDELTHLYTLILNSDNTYEVRIDGKKEESGKLEDDWDMLAPKKIKDPEAKKPEDWVDDAKINDPDDTKPEDWEKPELIPDTEAKKPDDWDDEEDGEWEAPMINNPEYKGEWKAKKIDNPAYKGEWVHPEIENPEYVADDTLYKYDDIAGVGFEIWQVKSGTIFDNIIVTDDIAEAEAFAKETFEATKDAEKKAKDEIDEEEKKKQEEEEKKREAEEKDKKPEADEEEEEEEEDEKEEGDDVTPEDEVAAEDDTTTEPKDEL